MCRSLGEASFKRAPISKGQLPNWTPPSSVFYGGGGVQPLLLLQKGCPAPGSTVITNSHLFGEDGQRNDVA